ncbi:MAG: histidinol-phosphate transaminase [Victivallaceae bacterium]
MKKDYFRPAVAAMAGYMPGEQPDKKDMVKLNTNENPYPPSPEVEKTLRNLDCARLRRYPNSTSDLVRDVAAGLNGATRENIIVGNGSDDLLTMIFRSFTSPELPMASINPSYTLYQDLAAMQEAKVILIELQERTFALPADILEQAKGANLLMIARPNSPTGNSFPFAEIENICKNFDGMVVIDEAYADFAGDTCMPLALSCPNVIVMRTLSKSYALAGARVGYAVSSPAVIEGLMKLKDSYNVDGIAQAVAAAALGDRAYLDGRVASIKASRTKLAADLSGLGFEVVDSSANFVFARPPRGDGRGYFEFLRDRGVFIRFFDRPRTREYVRITVGTPEEMDILTGLTREYLKK